MHIIVLLLTLLLFGVAPATEAGQKIPCGPTDSACAEFDRLADAGRYDAIVAKAVPGAAFSDAARQRIGLAFLEVAGQESNTPEQEERYCRKAIEYGQPQGYMGLYFLTAQRDPGKALGYLREYVATKPADAVPYVILGEDALDRGAYKEADGYLRDSKKVARARSGRVDWMLFQANYLMGSYAESATFLGAALQDDKFAAEWKDLQTDKRFSGIGKRPEFSRYVAAGK